MCKSILLMTLHTQIQRLTKFRNFIIIIVLIKFCRRQKIFVANALRTLCRVFELYILKYIVYICLLIAIEKCLKLKTDTTNSASRKNCIFLVS